MLVQVELAERPFDAFALAAAAKPVGAGEEIQILDDGELAIERELLRDVADLLPGRGAGVVQVDAGDAQRAAACRQQTAEHAERRRLAGPVGPEQTEDLAAVDLEVDMIDGDERAEFSDEVADFDDRFVSLAAGGRASVSDAATGCDPTGRSQQDHETVLEPRRVGTTETPSNSGSCGTWPFCRARPSQTARAPLRGRRRPGQGRPASGPAARAAVCPAGGSARKVRCPRPSAHVRRLSLRQHLAPVKDGDMLATFGLVEVRRAQEHRQPLIVNKFENDVPQFAARQRVDADRRLVEQE